MPGLAIIFKLLAHQDTIAQVWKLAAPIVNDLASMAASKTDVHPVESLKKYDMAWVQTGLRTPGMPGGSPGLKVTGVYGDQGGPTDLATRAFQSAHPPLKVDGIPGPQTAGMLEAEIIKLKTKV